MMFEVNRGMLGFTEPIIKELVRRLQSPDTIQKGIQDCFIREEPPAFVVTNSRELLELSGWDNRIGFSTGRFHVSIDNIIFRVTEGIPYPKYEEVIPKDFDTIYEIGWHDTKTKMFGELLTAIIRMGFNVSFEVGQLESIRLIAYLAHKKGQAIRLSWNTELPGHPLRIDMELGNGERLIYTAMPAKRQSEN